MFGGAAKKAAKRLEDDVARLSGEVSKLKAVNAALEEKFLGATENLESFQVKYNQMESDLAARTNRLAVADSELKLEKEKVAESEKKAVALDEQCAALSAQLRPLMEKSAELEATKEKLRLSESKLYKLKRGGSSIPKPSSPRSPNTSTSATSAKSLLEISSSPKSPKSTESAKNSCQSPKSGGSRRPRTSPKSKTRKSGNKKVGKTSRKSNEEGPISPEAPQSPLEMITNPIGSSEHGPLSPGGKAPREKGKRKDESEMYSDLIKDEEDMFSLLNAEIEEAADSPTGMGNLGVPPRGLESASVPAVPSTAALQREFSRQSSRSGSALRVDTSSGETRSLQTKISLLKTALASKNDRIAELEESLESKLKELVDQGEKNYSLYEKLQSLKSSESGMKHNLDEIRGLVVREIAGDGVDAGAYTNVTNEELIRVFKQAQSYDKCVPGRVASVVSEARSVRQAREREVASSSKEDADYEDSGYEDMFSSQQVLEADKGNSTGKGDSKGNHAVVTRVEAMRLQAELNTVKQANRRLQARIEHVEVIERTGNAAIESMTGLKRRGEDLARSLRREKDVRSKTEQELSKSNDRVQALTKHIEKLMIHLKHEAAAKTIAANEVKAYKKEAAILRQRSNVLAKKNKSRERMLTELREGSRILEDQLRLMDQKYVQLRSKLDWTRATSNREVKKIQLEANKLRASFALAYSQASGAGGDGSMNFNFKGMLGDDDDDDDDSESGSDSEEEFDGGDRDDNDEHVEAKLRDPSSQILDETDQEREQNIEQGKAKLPSDSLPAIESIIPQDERYQPRR